MKSFGSLLAFAIGLSFVLTHSAEAQRPRAQDVEAQLASSVAAEVRTGLENSVALGARGAPLVAARIEKGLRPDLLTEAVLTLSAIGHASGAPVLARLAVHHRNPEVRALALDGWAACDPSDPAVLATALDDSERAVRGRAAELLTEHGSGEQTAVMLRAFERGVTEVGPALGRHLDASALPRVMSFLTARPLGALTPIFDELFERGDIAASVRTGIVDSLAELATPEVGRYLRGVSQNLEGTPHQQVRDAARAAGERIQ